MQLAFVLVPFVLGALLFGIWTAITLQRRAALHARTGPGGAGGVRGDRKDAVVALAKGHHARGTDPVARGAALEFDAHLTVFRVTASEFNKRGPQTLWIGTKLPDAQRAQASAYRGSGTAGALTTPLQRLPHVVCRLEEPTDRLGKRLGLSVEREVGKKEFDDRYFIEVSSASAAIAPVLALDAYEQAAHAVTELGDAALVFNAEGHAVAIRIARHGPAFEPRALEAALEALAELARQLPPVTDPTLRKSRAWLRPVAAIIATLGPMAALFVTLFFSRALVGAGWLGFVAPITGGLFVFVTFLLWMAARGTPNGLRTFAVGATIALALIPGLTNSCLLLANRVGDESSQIVRAPFVSKRITTNKKSKSYWVTVGSWPDQPGGAEVPVSVSVYERAAPGSVIELDLGRGRLGFAWVRGSAVAAPR